MLFSDEIIGSKNKYGPYHEEKVSVASYVHFMQITCGWVVRRCVMEIIILFHILRYHRKLKVFSYQKRKQVKLLNDYT